MELLEKNIQRHIDAFEKLKSNKELQEKISLCAKTLSDAMKNGGKLLVFGNGGSAADSQHIAAEFVGKFNKKRQAFPAIAFNCNSSIVTAIGNDYDFSDVFSRQVEAFGKPADVAIGISTSGTSKDVVKALEKANELGLFTVMLTGEGCTNEVAKLTIKVPSDYTPTIQEMHIFIGHYLAEYVENEVV